MQRSDTQDIRVVYINNEPIPVLKEIWSMVLEAHVKGRVSSVFMTYDGKDLEVASDNFFILQ